MPQPIPEANTLEQWLAYIEAGHCQEIDLGLERIIAVAEELGVTALPCPVITVAGTNGKGSTVAYMRAILTEAGYRVGCYTSPHFIRYNERVTLGSEPVTDQLLCEAFTRVDQARLKAGVSLTYFEFGTLAALDIFSTQTPDVVLLEVGLGGRLDAVNIVDPDIAVVTTVAIDHESWLGSDREQIGYEKAGIFRAGIPALYGERSMPASVSGYAEQIGARLLHWGTDFGPVAEQDGNWRWQGRGSRGAVLSIGNIPAPELPFENASTAVQALKLLELDIPDGAVRNGITRATLTGRCQRARVDNRQVILDVAHNPHAAEHLVRQLGDVGNPVHCVIGMLEDKDIPGTLAGLTGLVDHWYPGSLAVPRGQSADRLGQYIADLNVSDADIVLSDTVCEAFDRAITAAEKDDLILVVGSFFTVAEVIEGRVGNS